MAKEQLLDLNVYGKGMETHIVAKSKMIGDYVRVNATRQYGEAQWTLVPESVAKMVGSDPDERKRVRLLLPSSPDDRSGNSYGYASYIGRGAGIIELIDGYGSGTRANPAIFLAEGLADGVHIILPRFIGQGKIDEYVSNIKDEAQYFYKKFLRPAQRRMRIFIEDYRYE